MAKNLGTFTFAANFQVKAAEALDPRMVAASKADLINKANWPSDGDTIYVYKGLIVDCGEDGVYRLIDPSKALASDYSGWQRIDVGGVKIDNIYTYKSSVTNYASLPTTAEIGDVYNVENAFTITKDSVMGDPIVREYPAGTNVAWNGFEWDPLGGSVDLSNYATKPEVSAIRTDVQANSESISQLSVQVGAVNAALDKKVDAVEGSSLITSEQLQLINTNAAAIGGLIQKDNDLDTRLKTIESAFTGEGGTVDLGELTQAISSQGVRISTLETNSATKEELNTLQQQANANSGRLTAIETVNTDQSNQLSSLTTRVQAVEAHGTAITNLTSTVNEHTQQISGIQDSISGLAVKSVAAGEKVLVASNTGELSTTIKLKYDEENRKIQLTGVQDAVVSELDATAFIKDGMLDKAEYDTATKELVLTWNTLSGKESMRVPLGTLVDIYTAGNGLQVDSNQFSIKLDTKETNRLTVSDDGLLVDISSDIAAMTSLMDDKISAAFAWQDVN